MILQIKPRQEDDAGRKRCPSVSELFLFFIGRQPAVSESEQKAPVSWPCRAEQLTIFFLFLFFFFFFGQESWPLALNGRPK